MVGVICEGAGWRRSQYDAPVPDGLKIPITQGKGSGGGSPVVQTSKIPRRDEPPEDRRFFRFSGNRALVEGTTLTLCAGIVKMAPSLWRRRRVVGWIDHNTMCWWRVPTAVCPSANQVTSYRLPKCCYCGPALGRCLCCSWCPQVKTDQVSGAIAQNHRKYDSSFFPSSFFTYVAAMSGRQQRVTSEDVSRCRDFAGRMEPQIPRSTKANRLKDERRNQKSPAGIRMEMGSRTVGFIAARRTGRHHTRRPDTNGSDPRSLFRSFTSQHARFRWRYAARARFRWREKAKLALSMNKVSNELSLSRAENSLHNRPHTARLAQHLARDAGAATPAWFLG